MLVGIEADLLGFGKENIKRELIMNLKKTKTIIIAIFAFFLVIALVSILASVLKTNSLVDVPQNNEPLTEEEHLQKNCRHQYSGWNVTTVATCSSEGEKARECTICNYSETKVIPKANHAYEVRSQIEATCTKQGSITYLCTMCKEDSYTVTLEASHTPFFTITAIEPTCTEAGRTAGLTCSVCDALISESVTIGPLGHNYGNWVVESSVSCIKEGIEYRLCSRCNKEDRLIIPPHIDEHNWSSDVDSVSPTCTTEGYDELYCVDCGTFNRVITSDALGHIYGDWVVESSVSCINEGIEYRLCSRCNKEDRLIIPPHIDEHNWSSDVDSVSPTCTTEGYDELYCVDCGTFNRVITSDALGHLLPSDWTLELQPTLNTIGMNVKRCEICGDLIEQEDVPALLNYELQPDNTYSVSMRNIEDIPANLEIPSHYMGVPVTKIKEYGFAGSKIITLIIPNTVTTINYQAFEGCSSLTTISISNSVTFIGPEVFKNCINLCFVYIPASVTSMGDYVFYNTGILGEGAGEISCGAYSKPEGWDENWIGGVCKVVWGA